MVGGVDTSRTTSNRDTKTMKRYDDVVLAKPRSIFLADRIWISHRYKSHGPGWRYECLVCNNADWRSIPRRHEPWCPVISPEIAWNWDRKRKVHVWTGDTNISRIEISKRYGPILPNFKDTSVFVCSDCELLVPWSMGHSGDVSCTLCDDCCVRHRMPCSLMTRRIEESA